MGEEQHSYSLNPYIRATAMFKVYYIVQSIKPFLSPVKINTL